MWAQWNVHPSYARAACDAMAGGLSLTRIEQTQTAMPRSLPWDLANYP